LFSQLPWISEHHDMTWLSCAEVFLIAQKAYDKKVDHEIY